MKMLKIGKLKVNPVLLAPMVDVTDMPYRVVCKEEGAGIVYTEMLHVEAIKHGGKKVKDKMRYDKKEKPLGIQITFREIKTLEDVVEKLKDYDIVDINCGCPSHLTVDHGSGVCLMEEKEKVCEAIKILKKNKIKVVSVKMRLGYKRNNAVDFAKSVENAGADAITVHGRLGNQGKSVKSDINEIKKVKDSVNIPVIGNGDVVDGRTAKSLLEFCDGVMIGRGAIGDPGVFRRVINYLENGVEENYDYNKNIKLFIKYLKYCEKYDMKDIGKIKYIGGDFLKGVKGASKLRLEFTKLKSFEDIMNFVVNLK